jgi:hypothetical protein
MTLFGKILAFLLLGVGLGIVSWSASVYFQRPSWFDPAPDAVDKGHTPLTFAQLKQDIDSLGRAASAASAGWGVQRKKLEDLEARRIERQKVYDQRIAWMKTGNPNKAGAAFFQPVYEKDAGGKATSVLDIAQLGEPVNGPDALPLKGADTLLANFSKDVAATIDYQNQKDVLYKEYDSLGVDILKEETRLLAMSKIRESVQAELFYLSSFEVNVYETRETVLRRKRQLDLRLRELGAR